MMKKDVKKSSKKEEEQNIQDFIEDFQEDPIEYEEDEIYFLNVSPNSVKVGRPRMFKSVKELQEQIDAYFVRCKLEDEVPCVTGLALALGCDRKTLLKYSKRPEFVPTIKRARLRCESEIEQRLVGNKLNPSSGIFNLKANYGWVEEFNFNTKNENTNHNTYSQEYIDALRQSKPVRDLNIKK